MASRALGTAVKRTLDMATKKVQATAVRSSLAMDVKKTLMALAAATVVARSLLATVDASTEVNALTRPMALLVNDLTREWKWLTTDRIPVLAFELFLFILAVVQIVKNIKIIQKRALIFYRPRLLMEVVFRDSLWYFIVCVIKPVTHMLCSR